MESFINSQVTTLCPVRATIYSHTSSLVTGATLLIIFSLVAAVQLMQGMAWKTWGYIISMLLGSLCEIAGYSGRLILLSNPWNFNASFVQMILLNMGPLFYTAGIYFCFSYLIEISGASLARIKPAPFSYIFLSCNILPFVLQGAGGILLLDSSRNNIESIRGKNLMIAGFGCQIAALLLFGALCVEYAIRVDKHRDMLDSFTKRVRSTDRLRYFCIALVLAYFLMMIRCIYRITELSGGWTGKWMGNETAFIVLDRATVMATCYVLTIVPPGSVFERAYETNEKDLFFLI